MQNRANLRLGDGHDCAWGSRIPWDITGHAHDPAPDHTQNEVKARTWDQGRGRKNRKVEKLRQGDDDE